MTIKETIEKIDDILSSDHLWDGTLTYELTVDDFEWLQIVKEILKSGEKGKLKCK